MENRHTIQELQELQALPLDLKIRLTKQRIREWIRCYGEQDVYVSFSGGKDSTVLLDIVRENYPKVTAMFVDVPTQYPELREFVKTYEDVDIVKTKIGYIEVVKKYGFPLISKEVSECVQGARKYLTSLLQENIIRQTDRQTDRASVSVLVRQNCWRGSISETFSKEHTTITNTRYHTFLERTDEYSKSNPSGGGYDNKYRKLRGIGEYSKRKDGKQAGRQQSAFGDNVRVAHERQEASDKGEYP